MPAQPCGGDAESRLPSYSPSSCAGSWWTFPRSVHRCRRRSRTWRTRTTGSSPICTSRRRRSIWPVVRCSSTAGFRRHHLHVHRWLGRAVLTCGLVCGVFAIVFGLLWPTGGASEATTTVVFGVWFEVCLLNAFRSVRGGRTTRHRRWMVRAYAVGSAVGTIRLIALALLPLGFGPAFAIAFPTAFMLHAAAAELWLNQPLVPRARLDHTVELRERRNAPLRRGEDQA
ncbi:DUF2306 domain-containing protein [Nocardioides sp. DS6]|uniref:DUF2306 domain-containing protein n=1 Tax=Nocardioides eburneus TaxID=3231482 RepID=A0ABV3SXB5_9ACTN